MAWHADSALYDDCVVCYCLGPLCAGGWMTKRSVK